MFSDNAIEFLESAEDINLRHNLNVIMNEKYTSTDKFDAAYHESKEAAKLVLSMLRDSAMEKGWKPIYRYIYTISCRLLSE